jgi:hypothetical protein
MVSHMGRVAIISTSDGVTVQIDVAWSCVRRPQEHLFWDQKCFIKVKPWFAHLSLMSQRDDDASPNDCMQHLTALLHFRAAVAILKHCSDTLPNTFDLTHFPKSWHCVYDFIICKYQPSDGHINHQSQTNARGPSVACPPTSNVKNGCNSRCWDLSYPFLSRTWIDPVITAVVVAQL